MLRYTFMSLSVLVTFLLFSFHSNPNLEKIEGYVYGSDGYPLIGANIQEEGSLNHAISDINGHFNMTVESEKSSIKISYIGFINQIVSLETKDLSLPIKITLVENMESISEVVVTHKAENKRIKESKMSDVSYSADYEGYSIADRTSNHHPRPPAVMTHHEEIAIENNNYDVIAENAFYDPTTDPLSTLSIDVDRASYSNVRRFLEQGNMPNSNAVRIEEMINYFDYKYDAPGKNNKRPFDTDIQITNCPWNREHQLMRVGLQAQKMELEEIPASNLVFLIDVSGSMNNQNKLPLLKSSFKLLTSKLRPEDKVAIVVYAGAAGCVLESTPGNETTKIMNAFDKLKAGGSTAGAAGIQLAYKIAKEQFIKGGNNRVILATDGDFNVGTSGDDALIRLIEEKRNDDIFLSILGFGIGNYMDSKMQKIANAGNGNHSYIDNMKEAKKVLLDEFSGTMFTIAKDVKIQIEFNPAVVQGYRMVGYENRVLAAKDFNDDTKDAGEMGAGHSVTVLYEIIPVGSNSSYSTSIDPLKYQENKPVKISDKSELGTIKYRYKTPTGKSSIKSSESIKYQIVDWKLADNSTQWASLVAEFGMLLRNSKYTHNGTYSQLIADIQANLKQETDQHKEEMLDLVEIAKVLGGNEIAEKE